MTKREIMNEVAAIANSLRADEPGRAMQIACDLFERIDADIRAESTAPDQGKCGHCGEPVIELRPMFVRFGQFSPAQKEGFWPLHDGCREAYTKVYSDTPATALEARVAELERQVASIRRGVSQPDRWLPPRSFLRMPEVERSWDEINVTTSHAEPPKEGP